MAIYFASNWDYFKSHRPSEITFAGSHNSASCYTSGNNPIVTDNLYLKKIETLPVFVKNNIIELSKFCEVFAKTQTQTLTDQFIKSNIRSFDIRVCVNPLDPSDTALYTHHTFLGKSFSLILQEFSALLSAYPQEIIQIKIKWTDSASKGLTQKVLSELFLSSNSIDKYIVPFGVEKTVDQYVSENKRAFIYIDEQENSPQVWGHLSDISGKYINTNIPDSKISQVKNQLSTNVSRNYELGYTLTPQNDDYISFGKQRFSFLSKICKCMAVTNSPSLKHLDNKLPKFDIKTYGLDALKIFIISMDFVEDKDVSVIAMQINKLKNL